MRAALLVLSTCLMIVFGISACAPRADKDDPIARITQKGELVWAGDIQGGEPYVYEDENDPGKLIGFEVEIAEALAKRLGVRARFSSNDWSSLVPALERGDFDIVLNGLESTPERKEQIALTRPYFAFAETLAVRRGDAAKSLDDMKGRKVATLNQTLAFRALGERPEIERAVYEGVREPYDELEVGRVDGVLLENIIADRYGCNRPTITCVEQESLRGVYVIGVRKNEPRLKEALDLAIADMMKDGELRQILTRWHIWDARQSEIDAIAGEPAERTSARTLGKGQVILFLEGAAITLAISVSAFALAIPIGMGLAIARLYSGKFGRFLAGAYIEIFRGTPVLLQLYVLYFGISTVVKLPPIAAAIVGLALNYAAYEAEVYRGALVALPRGQTEAASALGLTRTQTLRHVLLPQALRNALPAMTNDFVALLKDSSLVSVISVVELTKRMTIASVEIGTWLMPGLLCAALYFAMSYPLARLARRLEKRLARDPDPRST